MITDSLGNRRFFGTYRGLVFDSNDPENLGRVRIQVPQVLQLEVSGWAPLSYQTGITTTPPPAGAGVWVQFEGGDPSFPICIGLFGKVPDPVVIDCGLI
jgi:hypothetical protein